ncbi:ras-related protein ced-10-like [Antedon mediterranea]|uniref:ras-related protein ced-10-like n=1 Tax=Antedon mediterranea TaxID=105859 RepID=UPI003AF75BE0
MKIFKLKCVSVGDNGVGKTCLFIRECKGTFPESYAPPPFKNYLHDMNVEGKYVEMDAVDPTGTRGDYDRLRPLSYPNTDVFLICFDLSNTTSLTNVREFWYPEVSKHRPDTPIILVGTKLDLRENEDGTPKVTDEYQAITTEQGREMQKEIGALEYIECSAITGKGVNQVFYDAMKHAILLKPNEKKKSCNVL